MSLHKKKKKKGKHNYHFDKLFEMFITSRFEKVRLINKKWTNKFVKLLGECCELGQYQANLL